MQGYDLDLNISQMCGKVKGGTANRTWLPIHVTLSQVNSKSDIIREWDTQKPSTSQLFEMKAQRLGACNIIHMLEEKSELTITVFFHMCYSSPLATFLSKVSDHLWA